MREIHQKEIILISDWFIWKYVMSFLRKNKIKYIEDEKTKYIQSSDSANNNNLSHAQLSAGIDFASATKTVEYSYAGLNVMIRSNTASANLAVHQHTDFTWTWWGDDCDVGGSDAVLKIRRAKQMKINHKTEAQATMSVYHENSHEKYLYLFLLLPP